MNPSTAQARVIIDELVRNGVRHVVVCPGSRNAPLSVAVHEAAIARRLTLHVRIDERSAGFLALGLAKALNADGGRSEFAALVCTSGTAVANLHPAVLEAHHSGTPLLLLTADRPGELVGTGANQTIAQRYLFGPAAAGVDFPIAEQRTGQTGVWRATVCRAVARAATGQPVQVNIPFREPLLPDGDTDWPESLDGRPDDQPWTWSRVDRRAHDGSDGGTVTHLSARTLLVIGSGDPRQTRAAASVAACAGWPVIAEPSAVAPALASGAEVLDRGSLVLSTAELPAGLRPDAVVVVGRPTLSRGVQWLLRSTPVVHVVASGPEWVDPQHVATHVTSHLSFSGHHADVLRDQCDPGWLAGWRRIDKAAGAAVDALLGDERDLSGLRVAQEMTALLPDRSTLFLGSSNSIRLVDLAGTQRADLRIFANRGVAGIDGSVSTAAGLALAGPPGPHTYALLGDLTFLHDLNGLLIGPEEAMPNLTIVVLNDDGGGIFSLLEQGAPEHAASFERIFGTPHGADVGALCAGYRVPHMLVRDLPQLRAALRPTPGPRVVEVPTRRGELRVSHDRLRALVRHAVREAGS